MDRVAAIYLAHLNPFTNAHQQIISLLLQQNYIVYVCPVRFVKNHREINTRSFPFSYDIRRAMIESVFGNNKSVVVSPDYFLTSPFIKYLPPLVSPYSWMLRSQILRNVKEEKFITYTGDPAERMALSAFRLNPIKAARFAGSASAVKEMLYRQAITESEQAWRDKVPAGVADLIECNWVIVKRFARSSDNTLKVFGMKIPKEGFI
jgi:nicotinamide mononucleotide adenylyltransferase